MKTLLWILGLAVAIWALLNFRKLYWNHQREVTGNDIQLGGW